MNRSYLVNQFELTWRKSLTCVIESILSCESVWLDLLKEYNLYDWIDLILLISLTWSFGRVWPAGLNWSYLVDQFHWMLGQVNNLPETGLILWISLTWSCSCRQWHCAIPSKQRRGIFSNFNKFNQQYRQFLFFIFWNLLSCLKILRIFYKITKDNVTRFFIYKNYLVVERTLAKEDLPTTVQWPVHKLSITIEQLKKILIKSKVFTLSF